MAIVMHSVYEVRLEGYVASQRWMNTWHFARMIDDENPPDDDDLQIAYDKARMLAETIHNRYRDAVMPALSDQCVSTFTRAKKIAPVLGPFAVFGESNPGEVPLVGIDETDDAVVITKRTLTVDRHGLGRVFLPGIPDTAVSGGVFDAAAAQLLVDDLNTMISEPPTIEGEDFIAIVWSKANWESAGTLIAAAYPIVRLEIDQLVRRQIRREFDGRLPLDATEAP